MTRMTRPDCALMCNLINTHTHTHTHTGLMVGASPRVLGLVRHCLCDCMFWDERVGEHTPVGPWVDTATIAWTWEVLGHGAVRFGVHTRAQTLSDYYVSD